MIDKHSLNCTLSELALRSGVKCPRLVLTRDAPTLACATFNSVVIHPDLMTVWPYEVRAVLAHELGHIVHHHAAIRLGIVAAAFVAALACVLAGNIVSGVAGSFFAAGMYLFAVIGQEVQADANAVGLGCNVGLRQYLARGKSFSSKIRLWFLDQAK